jgi:hypothetical protein
MFLTVVQVQAEQEDAKRLDTRRIKKQNLKASVLYDYLFLCRRWFLLFSIFSVQSKKNTIKKLQLQMIQAGDKFDTIEEDMFSLDKLPNSDVCFAICHQWLITNFIFLKTLNEFMDKTYESVEQRDDVDSDLDITLDNMGEEEEKMTYGPEEKVQKELDKLDDALEDMYAKWFVREISFA